MRLLLMVLRPALRMTHSRPVDGGRVARFGAQGLPDASMPAAF